MDSSGLAITTATLGHPPLAELAPIVSRAGFTSVSMWPEQDWKRAIDAGWSPAAIRRLLADHGLAVWEAEAAVLWVGKDDPGPPYFEESPRRLLYEAAAGLGAEAILAVVVGDRAASTAEVADAFAGLCAEAAGHGLRIHLEFGLGTLVRSVLDALAVVQEAGATNARIVVDAWAMQWGPSQIEDLPAVPPDLIATVQLNDAPAERPADFARATRDGRLRPGHGAAPLLDLLQSLRDIGANPRFVLEVLNSSLLAGAGAATFARQLADDADQLGLSRAP